MDILFHRAAKRQHCMEDLDFSLASFWIRRLLEHSEKLRDNSWEVRLKLGGHGSSKTLDQANNGKMKATIAPQLGSKFKHFLKVDANVRADDLNNKRHLLEIVLLKEMVLMSSTR